MMEKRRAGDKGEGIGQHIHWAVYYAEDRTTNESSHKM